MPPRIGLALVLCFVFPCLVLGVDILMDPNGDGSLFAFFLWFARRSSDTAVPQPQIWNSDTVAIE
jgi:hypothetical protein